MGKNVTSVFEDRHQVFAWVHLIIGLTLIFFVCLHWLQSCCLPLALVELMLAMVMLFTYWRIRQGVDLAQQQDRMQVILDHSPIGMWMVDGNRKIQFLNRAWGEICGISEQQAQDADDYKPASRRYGGEGSGIRCDLPGK